MSTSTVDPEAVRGGTVRNWLAAHPFALAGGALLIAVLASLLIGSVSISPSAYFDTSIVDHGTAIARLDRTVLALLVGAALAVSSACVQAITHNPLGDPGLLGLQSGASLAMVLAISVFGVSALTGYLWFSFAGVAIAGLVVHLIGGLGSGRSSPVRLTITGAALTAAMASWTSAILLHERQTLEVFRSWQVGTVGGRTMGVIAHGLPFFAAGALLIALMVRRLNALALGDDLARSVGARPVRDRVLIGVGVVLLTGTATALAGPIAFAGLLATHAVRAAVGPDHIRLLPLAATWGAVLVVVADTVGRVVVPPTEVQVGIMTAVCGAPFFLRLVRSGRAAGR